MTRILYWNVNNYSRTKIIGLHGPTSSEMATNRLDHMLRVIAPVAPDPLRPLDLIIIVEVSARTNDIKTRGLILPPGKPAGQAILYLLNEIQQRTNEEWCLVPPPMDGTAGKREGVAIFYKPASLTFTGPWVYAYEESGAKLRLPPDSYYLSNLADYNNSYRACFPNVQRTWNVGPKVVPESQGAAQTEFGTVKSPTAYGTLNFPTADDRAPTHVRMLDAAGRTLKIFAVHTSPASAGPATRCIAQIPEVRTVNANEVSVVVGDFNVDSLAAVAPHEDPYYRLRDPAGPQYDMLLKARMTATGPVVDARQPYCMTHLLPNTRPT